MVVDHFVASSDPAYGGLARCVPELIDELECLGDTVRLRNHGNHEASWPDLVHDNGIWLRGHHSLAVACRRAGIPRVVSPHGMLETWALNHRRWKKRIAWALYQRRDLESTTLVHASSEAEAEGIRRLGLRIPLAVIPNGVGIPSEMPPWTTGDNQRALFLSRLHPIKGLPALVGAWASVRPGGWELVIAGPDENGYRAVLERLVSRLGLADQVRFIGSVSDDKKWALYRSADLFVLPTNSESFGLVVAEALAAEVPVITTKGAPWLELETHRCGWWTDIGVEPLAAALREAIALSDEQRRAMGARGRALVLDRYTWNRAALAMREVYQWILCGLDTDSAPSCVQLA